MKRIYFLIVVLILSLSAAFSQGKLIQTGSLEGYITLKCDFHSHTIFSDGDVWPTVRIDEAVRDGLDAIALTDHIEYNPHGKYLKSDQNTSWEIDSLDALKKNIILIHGAEITRKMPPGHFNALFIQDANQLQDTSFMKVIEEAIHQGAFIQWNHPGWKGQQKDGVVRVYDIHRELMKRGWMHGIEIFNFDESYPVVMDLCRENQLAMTGNSDIHGNISEAYPVSEGKHRPITLVFAKDRTLDALKAGMMQQMTLVWYGDTIAGNAGIALPFFKSSIRIGKKYYADEKYDYYTLENATDIPYYLIDGSNSAAPASLELKARSVTTLRLKKGGNKTLHFKIGNVRISSKRFLETDFELPE